MVCILFSALGSELVTALREILTLGIFVYSILSCVMMLLRIAQVIYPQWHCKILACVYNLLYLNSYSKTFFDIMKNISLHMRLCIPST